ncbi:MAG: stage II sporulation protein D [Acutalibacteraceae bacterium]
MKKTILAGLLVPALMLMLPLAAVNKPEAAVETSAETELTPISAEKADTFRIYDKETDTVTEMSAEEYIFGVTAAEMPALYEEEALKAQAVAAYTFALYRRAENADKTYDLSTDHTADQSYISEEKARERWGGNADEYCEKLKKAISEVVGLAVTYDGKPILAVYHAISSGRTENCKDIWGNDPPYLKAVDSSFDRLSPNYISKVTVSEEEFKAGLSGKCEFSGGAEEYFGNIKRTDSGTVKTVSICGKEISGSEIRSLFSLRSSNFGVSYKDGEFTFTVYGYGHGVGLSQFGADYMAKQGSDFKEILTHYYSGCRVEKLS